MCDSEYIELKRYFSVNAVTDLIDILKEHDIAYIIDSTKPDLDLTFTNGDLYSYIVKIPKNQLKKAEQILYDIMIKTPGTHYMDTFSTEELGEVIDHPEEWDRADYKYAMKLIKNKILKIPDEKD